MSSSLIVRYTVNIVCCGSHCAAKIVLIVAIVMTVMTVIVQGNRIIVFCGMLALLPPVLIVTIVSIAVLCLHCRLLLR